MRCPRSRNKKRETPRKMVSGSFQTSKFIFVRSWIVGTSIYLKPKYSYIKTTWRFPQKRATWSLRRSWGHLKNKIDPFQNSPCSNYRAFELAFPPDCGLWFKEPPLEIPIPPSFSEERTTKQKQFNYCLDNLCCRPSGRMPD